MAQTIKTIFDLGGARRIADPAVAEAQGWRQLQLQQQQQQAAAAQQAAGDELARERLMLQQQGMEHGFEQDRLRHELQQAMFGQQQREWGDKLGLDRSRLAQQQQQFESGQAHDLARMTHADALQRAVRGETWGREDEVTGRRWAREDEVTGRHWGREDMLRDALEGREDRLRTERWEREDAQRAQARGWQVQDMGTQQSWENARRQQDRRDLRGREDRAHKRQVEMHAREVDAQAWRDERSAAAKAQAAAREFLAESYPGDLRLLQEALEKDPAEGRQLAEVLLQRYGSVPEMAAEIKARAEATVREATPGRWDSPLAYTPVLAAFYHTFYKGYSPEERQAELDKLTAAQEGAAPLPAIPQRPWQFPGGGGAGYPAAPGGYPAAPGPSAPGPSAPGPSAPGPAGPTNVMTRPQAEVLAEALNGQVPQGGPPPQPDPMVQAGQAMGPLGAAGDFSARWLSPVGGALRLAEYLSGMTGAGEAPGPVPPAPPAPAPTPAERGRGPMLSDMDTWLDAAHSEAAGMGRIAAEYATPVGGLVRLLEAAMSGDPRYLAALETLQGLVPEEGPLPKTPREVQWAEDTGGALLDVFGSLAPPPAPSQGPVVLPGRSVEGEPIVPYGGGYAPPAPPIYPGPGLPPAPSYRR